MKQLHAVLLAIFISAVPAAAQDVTEQQIDLALSSKTCPSSPLGQASICRTILERCAANVNVQCDQEGDQCLRRERALNAKINAYNNVYFGCHKGAASSSNGGSSELSRALAGAKAKAQSADESNSAELQKMEAVRPEAVQRREILNAQERTTLRADLVRDCNAKNDANRRSCRGMATDSANGFNASGILRACQSVSEIELNLCTAEDAASVARLEADLINAKAERNRQLDLAESMLDADHKRRRALSHQRELDNAAAAADTSSYPTYSQPQSTVSQPAPPRQTYYPPPPAPPKYIGGGAVNGNAVH
jgi:hypothetical protein